VEAVTAGVIDGIRKLGIADKHSEIIDTITNIRIDPPDLHPILKAISRLESRGNHSEVLEAVTKIRVDPPDLQPILNAISHLEGSSGHAEILEAVTKIRIDPPDMCPMEHLVQDLRREFRRTSEEVAKTVSQDLAALASNLSEEIGALREEVRGHRRESKNDADVLFEEIKTLPQLMADQKQAMRKLEQKVDYSDVIQAIRKIKEPDYQAIANAVHSRALKVDHSEVLLHLKRLEPDHSAMATFLIERMKKTSLSVDHGEVLKALNKIRMPDHNDIAVAVHERLSNARFNVDHGEVLMELKRLKQDLDPQPVIAALQASEVDFAPVLDAVNDISVTVDHSPILEEIRKIKIKPPDHELIALCVLDHLKPFMVTVDHHREVMSAVKSVSGEPDLEPILSAIEAAEVDFGPIHDAISNINLHVDHSPILEAIRRSAPDHEEIASTLFNRLRKSDTELANEIRKSRAVQPDLAPVIKAIHSAEIDMKPVHEAIRRINVNVDHREVIRAINEAEIDFTPMVEELQKVRQSVDVAVNNTAVLQAIAQLQVEIQASRGVEDGKAPITRTVVQHAPVHKTRIVEERVSPVQGSPLGNYAMVAPALPACPVNAFIQPTMQAPTPMTPSWANSESIAMPVNFATSFTTPFPSVDSFEGGVGRPREAVDGSRTPTKPQRSTSSPIKPYAWHSASL
jgi:cell fate (sporulation/competence/biofilm development) regulator YlbF (YheA/YmcA/DUF963 family)